MGVSLSGTYGRVCIWDIWVCLEVEHIDVFEWDTCMSFIY